MPCPEANPPCTPIPTNHRRPQSNECTTSNAPLEQINVQQRKWLPCAAVAAHACHLVPLRLPRHKDSRKARAANSAGEQGLALQTMFRCHCQAVHTCKQAGTGPSPHSVRPLASTWHWALKVPQSAWPAVNTDAPVLSVGCGPSKSPSLGLAGRKQLVAVHGRGVQVRRQPGDALVHMLITLGVACACACVCVCVCVHVCVNALHVAGLCRVPIPHA